MNEGEETDWSYQINMNGQDVIPYNFYKSYILEHLYQSGEYHCCGLRRSSNKPKCSKTLSVTVSAYRPRATLTAGSTTIPVGGSVTLSCSVETSAGWKYRWFRRTSDISEVRIDNEENRDISVTQGGIYRCDGVRGNPDFYTVISNEETIETKFSNKVFVTQQPNPPQIFSGETITLTCEVQGGETTEWTYEWKRSETVLHRINSKDWTFIVSESSSGDYMCQCRRRDDWYSSTQWSKSITLSVSVTESSPVSSSFPVLLIVGPVIGVILFILLLLLWRHRQFKDLCCIRLFQSESSSQSSTTNHGVNQAESHVYSSLLHGNSCLYETIQTRGATGNERSHHPEEGPDYVNMKPDSSIG
ncbi:Fc receptor-like protein 5 isoform X3 [Girardinichthys multiradiatus]|nr:Fc receptor-like protein 5 isoform X3 [Girardinichthys multiradiatus]XP_047241994.1 Fc receptor-like protein 5 isoform X3 [Girardinichthys multiradiatus]